MIAAIGRESLSSATVDRPLHRRLAVVRSIVGILVLSISIGGCVESGDLTYEVTSNVGGSGDELIAACSGLRVVVFDVYRSDCKFGVASGLGDTNSFDVYSFQELSEEGLAEFQPEIVVPWYRNIFVPVGVAALLFLLLLVAARKEKTALGGNTAAGPTP